MTSPRRYVRAESDLSLPVAVMRVVFARTAISAKRKIRFQRHRETHSTTSSRKRDQNTSHMHKYAYALYRSCPEDSP